MALGAVAPIAGHLIGGVFVKPTERIFGFLPGTIVELQEGVEGKIANLNNRTYTDVQTVALMDDGRRSGDNAAGFQGVWTDLLPTWSPTMAALSEIRRRDPAFKPAGGTGGAGSSGGSPDVTPGAVAPAQTGKEATSLSAERSTTAGGLIGTMPLWLVLVLAGGLGYVAFKAFQKA